MTLHNCFSHQKSALVDVVPHARGEFVQVWNKAQGSVTRRLLLTYMRGPNGPEDVYHRIELDDDKFSIVEALGTQRTFYYRVNPFPPRVETILPSGRVLLSDPRSGDDVESVYAREFDWDIRKPKGSPLGDKAVMKLQSAGGVWFIATFQRHGDVRTLVVVEEYLGHKRLRLNEVADEV